MVQMTPADQAVIKAIKGNEKCADCGQKNPQWASVSFGTVFCLECSGIHRSLGVHITFVRSIAMDSWTDPQLALMKAGGNAACAKYLSEHGVSPNTPIKQKYESPVAQLYKEVLKARVQGKPEPTSLPAPAKKANSGGSYSSSSSFGGGGGGLSSGGAKKVDDPNGMERLTGESEEAYVKRQTRLRAEAKARMAAKFGNGGMGSRTMGGVGSDSSYNPHGGYGGGGLDVDNLVSGFGSALSTLGAWGSSSIKQVSSVVNDPNLVNTVKSTTAGLVNTGASTGGSLWSSLSSTATTLASAIAEPDADDGMAELQRKMHAERENRVNAGNSRYSGFGSDDVLSGKTRMGASKINDGNNANDMMGFSDNWGNEDGFANSEETNNKTEPIPPAPSSTHSLPVVTNPHLQKKTSHSSTGNLQVSMKKMEATGDDFFSSFGA